MFKTLRACWARFITSTAPRDAERDLGDGDTLIWWQLAQADRPRRRQALKVPSEPRGGPGRASATP